MKRFLTAAFFIALVALLAACGVLNANSAAAQETATPTGSTSRTQRSESVQVNETAAKVDVVTANNGSGTAATAAPSATAAPAAETPATGDIPVIYLAFSVGLILICSGGLLMLHKI